MTISNMDRRHLLRAGGALSMLGAAAPFALQLAAASSASGQSASSYRALVCIFLFGGNDANNAVLATDTDSWGRYFAARNTGSDPIALMPVGTAPTPVGQVSPVTGRTATPVTPEAWGGVVPITPSTPNPVPPGTNATTRTFALHPFLAPMANLFSAGRLAIVANLGTMVGPLTKAQYQANSAPYPASLYSHNDQQSTWEAGGPQGAQFGWGGQFADLLATSNGSNSLFTAISVQGNAVFLSGQSVVQYQLSTTNLPAVLVSSAISSSLFGSSVAPAIVQGVVQDTNGPNLFMQDYSSKVIRSMNAAATLNASFGQPPVTTVAAPPPFTNPLTGQIETNSLAVQLQTVAKMIAANANLGLLRQVFLVSLGGWDTHKTQNAIQPNLLAKVAHALTYFDAALSNISGVDMRSNVTAFTASDFSRTFTTNGSGTDHAWGSHHFVWGGAVNGGNIYGQFPTVGVDLGTFKNPNMAGQALVPSTSVDQYGATLGRWLGVSDASMDVIFPNLKKYAQRYLSFI